MALLPEVGLTVNYWSDSGTKRAAIVTRVVEPSNPNSDCDLFVMYPSSHQHQLGVTKAGDDDPDAPNTWNYRGLGPA